MESEVEQCTTCSLVRVHLAGPFSGEALLEVLSEIEEISTEAEGRTEVWDVRDVRDLYLKPAEAKRLESFLPECEGDVRGRTAVMARTSSQRSYGAVLCRSLRPYARAARPFFEAERAARWLGCPPAPGESKDDADVAKGACSTKGTCSTSCLLRSI